MANGKKGTNADVAARLPANHQGIQKLEHEKGNKKHSSTRPNKGGIMRPLGPYFNPGPTDVICARGGAAYSHSGNCRFRAIIEMNAKGYSEAESKTHKSTIVSTIVASIRDVNPRGRFVKKEGGEWHEVGEGVAREKVGQSLRDSLHTMYRSSSKAKQYRSKLKEALAKNDAHNKKNDNNDTFVIPGGLDQLYRSTLLGNSVQSVNNRKETTLSLAETQAFDTLPANSLLPNSAESCDYSELFPMYSPEDNSSLSQRNQHDNPETNDPSGVEENTLPTNCPSVEQIPVSNIFRTPFPSLSDQLVDDTIGSADAGEVAVPPSCSEVQPSMDSAAFIAPDLESSGGPLGIPPIGTHSFDEVFENDDITNE